MFDLSDTSFKNSSQFKSLLFIHSTVPCAHIHISISPLRPLNKHDVIEIGSTRLTLRGLVLQNFLTVLEVQLRTTNSMCERLSNWDRWKLEEQA